MTLLRFIKFPLKKLYKFRFKRIETSKVFNGLYYFLFSLGTFKLFTFKVQKDETVILNSKVKGLLQIVLKGPRTYPRIPILLEPIYFYLEEEQFLTRLNLLTKDKVEVNIEVNLIHMPEENDLFEHYRHYKFNYANEAIPSLVEDSVKEIIREYKSVDILMNKVKIVERLVSNIISTGAKNYIRISHIEINILSLPEVISEPIYNDLVKQSLFRLYLN